MSAEEETESPAAAPTLPLPKKNREDKSNGFTPGGRTPKKGYKGDGTTRRANTKQAWADFTPTPWCDYGGASNMWFNAYAGTEFMAPGTNRAGGGSKSKGKKDGMDTSAMWPSTPTPKSWGPTPTPSVGGCGGMGGFGMAGMPPMGMPPVNLVAMAQMAEAAAAAANAAAAQAAVDYQNAVSAQHQQHRPQKYNNQLASSTESSPQKEVSPPYPSSQEAPAMASASLDGQCPQGLPSKGSNLHGTGKCRPCAWFWKPQSCQSATECGYCHMCPEGELKSRKKVKVSAMRAGALAPAQHGNPPGVARTLKLTTLL